MKNPTVKKITIIIIAIVAVAMVSLLTIFILKSFLTKNNSDANKKIVTILSSTEVISSFKTAGLSNDKYTKQANVPAIIQHKLDSELYGISLSSSVSIIYSTASNNKASDTNTIQTQTISYMTDNGFTEISPKIYNANKNIKYKTFKNNKNNLSINEHRRSDYNRTKPFSPAVLHR